MCLRQQDVLLRLGLIFHVERDPCICIGRGVGLHLDGHFLGKRKEVSIVDHLEIRRPQEGGWNDDLADARPVGRVPVEPEIVELELVFANELDDTRPRV